MCGYDCIICANAIGSTLYSCERLTAGIALSAVICCLVATLTVMVGMGIGLGYNYCYVDKQIVAITTTTGEPDLLRFRRFLSPQNSDIDDNLDSKDNSDTDTGSIDFSKNEIAMTTSADSHVTSLGVTEMDSTMLIPLQKPDLLSLITRLVQNNKNVTLELVHG